MKERKLHLEGKITVNRSKKLVITYSFLLIASQASVDIKTIFSIKKSKIVEQDWDIFQAHYHGT